MNTHDLNRRMAAWLLMLPGPWLAGSRTEALREAKRLFDARITEQQFEEALRHAGYAFEASGLTCFAVRPVSSQERGQLAA